jgi:hypothetical protein
VFQEHERRRTDFRKGRQLGTLDQVVVWNKPVAKPDWLSQEDFDEVLETMQLREAHGGSKVLVGTLLAPAQVSAQGLKALYAQRWNVELDLRNIETTLGLDRLACKTPSMNEKQWYAGLLACNPIRLLKLRPAKWADVLPPAELQTQHATMADVGPARRASRRGADRTLAGPDGSAPRRPKARTHRTPSRQTNA